MEGIRIDAGADIVQLHLCRIADVHAVDFDGSEQQHEGQDHVDGHDDEDGEKGHKKYNKMSVKRVNHV